VCVWIRAATSSKIDRGGASFSLGFCKRKRRAEKVAEKFPRCCAAAATAALTFSDAGAAESRSLNNNHNNKAADAHLSTEFRLNLR